MLRSPAKINWYLRVLDKRPDGYHNLETVFHEISVFDSMSFGRAETTTCTIEGFGADVPTDKNLIFRAWETMQRNFPEMVKGLHVEVDKQIPMGGGLGGGSSNAATTLKAINELYNLQLLDAQLHKIGVELGSDVAFFIRGGAAVGRGRGEQLERLTVSHNYHLVLVFPGEHVSTADAYARLSNLNLERPDVEMGEFTAGLTKADLSRVAASIYNDFEAVVGNTSWFHRAKDALLSAGCLRAFMTGSGSTMVGLCANSDSARGVVRSLQGLLPYRALYAHTVVCK